jgi:signal peptidase I
MIFKLYENNNNPFEGKHLIKRVIGLPGEHVVVKNGVTTIYNKSNPNGFILEEPQSIRFVQEWKFLKKTKSV